MTKLVENDGKDDGLRKRCRIVLVPEFSETGILVLINLRSLGVKIVRFRGENMTGSMSDTNYLDGKSFSS